MATAISRLTNVTRTATLVVGSTLIALAMSACSGIEVETTDPNTAALAGFETYAWSKRIARTTDGTPINDDLLAERLRRAIDRRLDERGMRRLSTTADADVIATIGLGVAEGVEQNDPYFAQYVARRYERGIVTLSFVDRATQKLLWRGTAKDHIRYSARAVGAVGTRWVQSDDDRVWHVGHITDELLDALKR